jgi:O-antigen ligase
MDATGPGVQLETGQAGKGSRAALLVLVVLIVLSPWATGAVDPPFTRTIALVSLATSLAAVAHHVRHGGLLSAPIPLWPMGCLWLLAAAQLLPLPAALHAWLAPGSAAVWHPATLEAADVLGPGPRPISIHPDATLRALALATGLVTLALAAAPALRERRMMLRAAVAIVAGGVAVALYAVVARLAFGNRLYGVWSVPTVAPFGPFVNKNHFAGYTELVALLAVGLAAGLASEARRGEGALGWIESRRARFVVLAWGASIVLGLAVLVSLSRGGAVSLCAGLVTFGVLRLIARRKASVSPRALLTFVAGAVLVAALFVAALPDETHQRMLSLAGVASETSGSFRLRVWSDTLRLVSSSPWLGSGFGAFEDAFPRFKTAAGDLLVAHAESDYLELLAEGGTGGFVLAIVGVALVLGRGVQGALSASQRLARGLAAGALGGIVALLFHSGFDFNIRIPSNALMAGGLVSVILGASPATGTPRSKTAPRVVLALTLLAAFATPWSPVRFDSRQLTRADGLISSSLRRANLETEVASYMLRRPADPAPWLALAWLRHPASRDGAAKLAGWAVNLDPTSAPVRAAADRLGGRP